MKSKAFQPSSELIFTTVEQDRLRLIHFCKQLKEPILMIDLKQVKHCDSAGLAFLIEAKRLARRYKKQCVIKEVNAHILSLAQFCGVEKVLWVNTPSGGE